MWQSKGREPVKVMHFSDVHIDREYTVGIKIGFDKVTNGAGTICACTASRYAMPVSF